MGGAIFIRVEYHPPPWRGEGSETICTWNLRDILLTVASNTFLKVSISYKTHPIAHMSLFWLYLYGVDMYFLKTSEGCTTADYHTWINLT